MTNSISTTNDQIRQTIPLVPAPHKFMVTVGVAALPEVRIAEIIETVRSFDDFNRNNDPHGEHDLGLVVVGGQPYLWKIDYYDDAFEFHHEDGNRVLLIMRADDY